MQHDHILKTFNFNQVKGQGQCHSDHEMLHGTQPSQDEFNNQILDSTLNNIGYMLLDTIILEMRSMSKWPENGIKHSDIQRSIHTPNLWFLPQTI